MDWARTLRIDASTHEALQDRVAALARDGVRVRSGCDAVGRTYVLVEGPQAVDPAEVAQRIPDARWYDAAIIALAVEPQPADALPHLEKAMGGPGAPAGMVDCAVLGSQLVVEFRPDVTHADLIARIIDVELRRFGGSRRTTLLTPLPTALAAAIAARGLQAAEITSDRLLERLLGLEHVE